MDAADPTHEPVPHDGAVLDGTYRLEHVLGRGGMGVVYRAQHLHTRRTVALKLIAPRFLAEPEFAERFRREAEATGRLRHPNVVDVTDFGFAEIGGQRTAYLVMEYLDGCSLEDVLSQEGALPLAWAADVMDQACAAVAEAHRRGIVHRDLKPANLWLEPDRRGGYTVKVLDFGLARLESRGETVAPDVSVAVLASPVADRPIDEQETQAQVTLPGLVPATESAPELTRVGAALGTPLYMSPEQCRGARADERSDVYSLGVIAYRLVCGRTPFSGTAAQLLTHHRDTDAPVLAGRGVTAPVAELIASALAKDPAARPAGPAAFGAAFAARAEGAGSLLRQAMLVLLTQPRVFVTLALLGVLPTLVASVLASPSYPDWRRALDPAQVGAFVAWGLVQVLAVAGGLMAASALCQPVVALVLTMPLRPVDLRSLVRTLRPRAGAYAGVVRTFLLGYAAWSLPAIILTLVAATRPEPQLPWVLVSLPLWAAYAGWLYRSMDAYAFAAGAILMEGLGGAEAIARSRALAQRARRELPWFQEIRAAIFVPSFGLAVWVVNVIESRPSMLKALAAAAVLCPVVALAGAFMLVATGLLYFKIRQAAGEPLDAILADFERSALPVGYWQQQVRARIRQRIEGSG